ncbi:uncharacterized protein LOC131052257 isoform X2 [Cryptomeria japonica]|uniref:uncharacterized protein LOC131052257 isoform X2 n=1 Tax=Cryptomeria japonica TaxID=3369 RepID=UPI0027D9DFE8|nr:uncharacterized protein LOC131052257 isoform X2 [Cryptomeria japonica]
MKSIQPFQFSPYSDCLWKPRTVKLTPLRLPSRNKKHLILGAIGNGENRASQDVELDQQQTMDLQFGIRIGEDSEETSSKVIGKKAIKGMDGLLLKRPLPNLLTKTDVRKLTDIPSSQTGSKNNTEKRKSLDLVRPVKRKEGKEAVSSDLTRLGIHTKTFPAGSNSMNITDEVLLRKPYAQNKGSETLGFVSRPITPYFLSNKKEDKSKRHLEDTGLLRRPEAQVTRIDNNSNEIPGDLKAEEVIIEDLLGSKTDNANAQAAAHKQNSERGDMKREHKISAIRPTMPKNLLMSTAHEMDSHNSNRNAEHESYHEMHGKEDVSSFSSKESQEMNDSAPASVKSDKMFKVDANVSGLVATPPAKMNHQQAKQCIQDSKEGADYKVESHSIQQTTSVGLESVKLKVLRPMGSPRVYLSEENVVKRKTREDLPRHPLVNEISGQHSIRVCSEPDTGLDSPPCGKELEEKTHISDGPEDDSEKTFSHLINSFPSDHSDGAEDVLDKKVHQSTSDDSELQKLLHEMVPHASSRHTKKFESNVQISNQAKEISSQAVEEGEDHDWALAEILHGSGGFEEVELLSCSNIGFVVSFGSLLGLLPYRDLSFKKRPFPFEVWLQKKVSDPSKFQKELGSESGAQFNNSMPMPGLTFPNNEAAIQSEDQKSAMTAHESQNLLNLYNQDRTKFLSSFLGQKTRATVTLVDRKSGRLLFSEKAKENRESIEKKASVMVLKVKVCGLDRSRHRINLSLKQLKPDPLLENLESILKEDDDHTSSSLEHAELNSEWPEIESLIRELEAEDGIQNVSKGRLLLSTGLAPSFQVYLSDTHGDQYKILARSENRIQEIIVQASLDRDGMKSAVVSCTSRVAQGGGQ